MHTRLLLLLVLTALLHHSIADDDTEPPPPEEPATDDAAPEEEEAAAKGDSGSGGASCKVADFTVGAGYHAGALLGTWHVVDDTGLVPLQRTFDALFYTFQDLKHHFVQQDDGTIKDITSVRTPVGCYTQVGVLVESDQSGKFTSSFPTAWFPAQRNPSPFWIVAMNSKSWALIYSCRKLSEDGSCERKHTTAWTMSRSPDGFTNEVAQEVHAAVDALCIEYDDFQPMPKSTTCPEINPDDFPNVVKPKAEL